MGAVLSGPSGIPVVDPAWAPALTDVAALVPNRTVSQGGTVPVINGTFTVDTIPTATQVGLLIEQADAWVTASTGTVAATLYPVASAVAAMRTAGLVQTAYPVSDASYGYGGQGNAGDDVGARWFAQADAALKTLVVANLAAGGGAGSAGASTAAVVGTYSFPREVLWGDQLLL